MSRYLTPTKVGLLALISVYVEGAVPATSTIPILSFILSHLLPPHNNHYNQLTFVPILSIEDIQSGTITWASGIPGRTVWDLLLKKLWAIDSFDALHVFFDSLATLMAKSREEIRRDEENGIPWDAGQMRLSGTSPLGTFVRRAQLEFLRLQLDDSIDLWKDFVVYRQPTFTYWRRRNPNLTGHSFDTNLADGFDGKVHDILYGYVEVEQLRNQGGSTDDLDKLLEFQVDQMQKTGHRLSGNMKRSFEQILRSGVVVPSRSYYIRFLDAWKAGDYPSSFDNLHRYFDYTMQSRDRTFYQYALLNLALLQADFGCYSEAMAAMHESISTARENKDMACLNYSLSWLYHFGKAHPREISGIQRTGVLGTDREALSFLKAKAKDTGMWSLLSTSLLGEAKLAQSNGESLAIVFESLTKASYLNITKNITNVISSQMGVESSLFARLGIRFLAWSRNDLSLECYADDCTLEDQLHAVCRAALFLVAKGCHTQALASMDDLNPEVMRSLKHRQFWMAYMEVIKLRNALHRADLKAADHYLAQFRANPSPNHDIAFTAEILAIDLHIRRGHYSEAMEMLERYAETLKYDESDMFQAIKLMVLKARIWDKAELPQKGFSIAIRAASLSYKARYLPILWEAIGAICRILLSLKEFDAAALLLRSIAPQVLEYDDCNLTADTFLSLADSHMGMAGIAELGSSKRKENMTKTLEYLEKAFDEYSRIEDIDGQCEAMAKRATIMHINGDLVLANDYAAVYLDLQKANKDSMRLE